MKVVSLPIEKVISEYDQIRSLEKKQKERKTYLATLIKEYAEKNGVKDDKGSYYAEKGDYFLGKQCRKSISLKEGDVVTFLKNREELKHCVITKEIVDEDAFAKCVESEMVSQEELENLINVKTSYAVVLKSIEEMPEAEVFELQLLSAQVKGRK